MNKGWLRFHRGFIIILLVIFLSGCAFATRKTFLEYKAITPIRNPNNVTIEVTPFEDDRPNRDTIGNVKNIFGVKTANILSEINISQWITDALKSELENAGYKIVEKGTRNKIQGIVMKVYCNTLVDYQGEVIIKVLLKRQNNILLNKVYYGQSSSLSGVVVLTLKSYRNILEKSLQQAMIQVVSDVDEILRK